MDSHFGSAALAEPGTLVVHGVVSWQKWSSGGTAAEFCAAALTEPGAEAADAVASAQVMIIPLGPFCYNEHALLLHAMPPGSIALRTCMALALCKQSGSNNPRAYFAQKSQTDWA